MENLFSQKLHKTDGIIFAEDFDVEISLSHMEQGIDVLPDDVAPTPPVRMFDEREVEDAVAAAVAVARAEARAEVLADVAAEREASIAVQIELIAGHLATLQEGARVALDEQAECFGRAVFGVLASLLPAWSGAHDARETAALIRQLLAGCVEVPALKVQVSDQSISGVQAALLSLEPVYGFKIDVVAKKNFAPGDVVVTWDGGVITRSSSRVMDMIGDLLKKLDLLPLVHIDGVALSGPLGGGGDSDSHSSGLDLAHA